MRFTYGIGIQFRANGTTITRIVQVALKRRTLERCAEVFGGCFVKEGSGAWLDPHGNLIVEPGIEIVADTTPSNRTAEAWVKAAEALAEELRLLWQQTSVHFTQSVSTSKLVSAK